MDTPAHAAAETAALARATRRRVYASTMIGNVVEYYDFTLYGTLAAVLAKLFFPSADPMVALFSTYAGCRSPTSSVRWARCSSGRSRTAGAAGAC
ncbi:hypothetical protein [Streptomyces rapamycinicus]|uniref:hypothetical protein n=1 Tax=Streptomyces rapamycinicus TaxID=1226757 RepID=UPI0020C9C986|nr:hypothetical protein [Streptomyces rapamycinicus]UTP28079.1 hypothetical protein LIV37_01095 [Streptomyces rapamycinicus NRRL 5491]